MTYPVIQITGNFVDIASSINAGAVALQNVGANDLLFSTESTGANATLLKRGSHYFLPTSRTANYYVKTSGGGSGALAQFGAELVPAGAQGAGGGGGGGDASAANQLTQIDLSSSANINLSSIDFGTSLLADKVNLSAVPYTDDDVSNLGMIFFRDATSPTGYIDSSGAPYSPYNNWVRPASDNQKTTFYKALPSNSFGFAAGNVISKTSVLDAGLVKYEYWVNESTGNALPIGSILDYATDVEYMDAAGGGGSKPLSTVKKVDLKSFCTLQIDQRLARCDVVVTSVCEGGTQTGVTNINWGEDNAQGTSAYTYFNDGRFKIQVTGQNGTVFTYYVNYRKSVGVEKNEQVYVLDDAKSFTEYFTAITTDTSGNPLEIGSWMLDGSGTTYTPIVGFEIAQAALNQQPEKETYTRVNLIDVNTSSPHTVLAGTVHSISLQVTSSIMDVDFIYPDGSINSLTFTPAFPMPNITAVGGYLDCSLTFSNGNGLVTTLS